MVRTAPAKKRKQSTIAGISSWSTRMRGLPQLSASSVAKASASRLDGVGELQQERRALGGRGARPGLRRPSSAACDRGVDLRRGGIGKLDDGLLGLGIEHASGASVPATNFEPISICVSSMTVLH